MRQGRSKAEGTNSSVFANLSVRSNRDRSLLQEGREGGFNFRQKFFFAQRLSAFVLAACAMSNDTAADVIGQKFNAQAVQSSTRSRDLVEDFEAVAVVIHHFPMPLSWPAIRLTRDLIFWFVQRS